MTITKGYIRFIVFGKIVSFATFVGGWKHVCFKVYECRNGKRISHYDLGFFTLGIDNMQLPRGMRFCNDQDIYLSRHKIKKFFRIRSDVKRLPI